MKQLFVRPFRFQVDEPSGALVVQEHEGWLDPLPDELTDLIERYAPEAILETKQIEGETSAQSEESADGHGDDDQGYPLAERTRQLIEAGVTVDFCDTRFASAFANPGKPFPLPDPSPGVSPLVPDDAGTRPLLRELDPSQQALLKDQFELSSAVFDALASGEWTDETWEHFWGGRLMRVAAVPVSPRRSDLTISTKQGPRIVKAWGVGPLAIHRSWEVHGWAVTHTASGHGIASRLLSKDVAIDLAQRLLAMDCDWSSPSPLTEPVMRSAVLAVLKTAPLYCQRHRKEERP